MISLSYVVYARTESKKKGFQDVLANDTLCFIMLSPILSVVSKKDGQRTRICKSQAAQD